MMSRADTILRCEQGDGNCQKVRLCYADGRTSEPIKVELPEFQKVASACLAEASVPGSDGEVNYRVRITQIGVLEKMLGIHTEP